MASQPLPVHLYLPQGISVLDQFDKLANRCGARSKQQPTLQPVRKDEPASLGFGLAMLAIKAPGTAWPNNQPPLKK